MRSENEKVSELLNEAMTEKQKTATVRRGGGAATFLKVVDELRDNKRFTWEEIKDWFEARGIIYAASTWNHVYCHRNNSKPNSHNGKLSTEQPKEGKQ
jgi:hypothetical protein